MPPADRRLRLLVRHSAAEKDVVLAAELLRHLEAAVRFAGVDVWSDDRIRAGDVARLEIDRAIQRADVALLLLSADFLVADGLMDVEVPQLLARHRAEELRVIPVVLRSCLWEVHPWLKELHPLPRSGAAIGSFSVADRDAALTEVVKEVLRLARPGSSSLEGVEPSAESAIVASPDYYVYISDAKVDLLLPQIPPPTLGRITADLGIDPNALSASAEGRAPPLSNRVSRLRAVVHHLRRRGRLGGLADEPEYIEGTADLSWGLIESRHRDGPVAFFGGNVGDRLLVLVGSDHHLIGRAQGPAGTSASPYFFIMQLLRSFEEGQAFRDRTGMFDSPPLHATRDRTEMFEQCRLYTEALTSSFHYPCQRLTFVAKRYGSGAGVTIGSPLSVAMAE